MRAAFRLLTSLALVAPATAMAADYDPPLVIESEPVLEEVVPVEIGSGWYLRGDLGYGLSASRGAFNFRTFNGGAYTDFAPTASGYATGLQAGIGFGYRFTDWVRADAMLERFDAAAFSQARLGTPCPLPNGGSQPAGTDCDAVASGVLTNYSLMANAYVDLGTIARFTPYLGAGAGVALSNWGDGSVDYRCVPGAVTPCNAGSLNAAADGFSSVRFTYAAMAGVAFDINKNLKLDLGYKFRAVAGGNAQAFSQADQNAGARGAQLTDPGFFSHEIRLGLRYELW